MDDMADLNPVTIVRSRYGGIYEPGEWLTFPLRADALPEDWDGSDVFCVKFWTTYRGLVGGGDTPQAALDDLVRKSAT